MKKSDYTYSKMQSKYNNGTHRTPTNAISLTGSFWKTADVFANPNIQLEPASKDNKNKAPIPERIKNRKRPKRNVKTLSVIEKKCDWCEATKTPEWRNGSNQEILCNACGLQERNYVKEIANTRAKFAVSTLINTSVDMSKKEEKSAVSTTKSHSLTDEEDTNSEANELSNDEYFIVSDTEPKDYNTSFSADVPMTDLNLQTTVQSENDWSDQIKDIVEPKEFKTLPTLEPSPSFVFRNPLEKRTQESTTSLFHGSPLSTSSVHQQGNKEPFREHVEFEYIDFPSP